MNRWADRWTRHMTRMGHARARSHLLAQSDRTLADAGFSRELLKQGVDAWPWRHDDAPSEPLAPSNLQGNTMEVPNRTTSQTTNLQSAPESLSVDDSYTTQSDSAFLLTRQSAA